MPDKNPTKGVLQTNNVTSKNFSYQLDGVSLNISLRTDIKKDMVSMLKILDRCKADIEDEIKKIK